MGPVFFWRLQTKAVSAFGIFGIGNLGWILLVNSINFREKIPIYAEKIWFGHLFSIFGQETIKIWHLRTVGCDRSDREGGFGHLNF